MKNYTAPIMEVITFGAEDIIVTSSGMELPEEDG